MALEQPPAVPLEEASSQNATNPKQATPPPSVVPRTSIRIFRWNVMPIDDRVNFLMRRRLQDAFPEPSVHDPDTTALCSAHAASLKRHIEFLKDNRSHIEPDDVVINAVIAEHEARRSFLLCRIFRINELPPEILTSIFRYVAWSTETPTTGINYRLYLTWTCRHWRHIALGDLNLWNAVWFRDPFPHTRSFAFLERAGSAPLDLRLSEQDDLKSKVSENKKLNVTRINYLLDRILKKKNQLRMFIAVVDDWPPALVIIDRFRKAGLWPRLERFELHRAGEMYTWIGPDYEPREHRSPMPLCGGGAPRLRYVCLNGVHVDWAHSPLRNITTLDLRRVALHACPDIRRFREILTDSPHLHKLTLDGAGPLWNDKHPEEVFLEPVTLHKLRIFVIGDVSGPYSGLIMKHIRGPEVRDLTVMNMVDDDYGPFLHHVAGKFPNIRVLTLYSFDTNNTDVNRALMARWIDSMPCLGYLRAVKVKPHWIDVFSENPARYGITVRDHHKTPPLDPELTAYARHLITTPNGTQPRSNPLLPAACQQQRHLPPPPANPPPPPATHSDTIPPGQPAVAIDLPPPPAAGDGDARPSPFAHVAPTPDWSSTFKPIPRCTPILAPKLLAFEVQMVDVAHVISWAFNRKQLGFTLSRINVDSRWANQTLPNNLWQELQSRGQILARNGIGQVWHGMQSMEERRIFRGD